MLGRCCLETDSEGKKKNALFIQTDTKSRQGDNSLNFGPVKPRMYDNEEIQEERNPVNVYNLYRKTPQGRHDGTRRSILSDGQPLQIFCSGVNKLKSILKDVRRIGNSHKNKPRR